MGYTHYWRRPQDLDMEKFKAAVEDCKVVCDKLSIPLGDWDGKGEPVFTYTEIALNGKGDDDSCETFHVPQHIESSQYQEPNEQGRYIDFCKTNYRPYDIVVQCCLLVFQHHFPDDEFVISSDGGESEWKDAHDMCESTLGYEHKKEAAT